MLYVANVQIKNAESAFYCVTVYSDNTERILFPEIPGKWNVYACVNGGYQVLLSSPTLIRAWVQG